MSELAVVIPTLGKPTLAAALARLSDAAAPDGGVEVVVVADASLPAPRLAELRAIVDAARGRPRLAQADRAGASAARNRGLELSRAPVVLFFGDDILASRDLLVEHAASHRRHPEPEVGVLGHVRWADRLTVTPFMRWLEHGIQFDFESIPGEEAGWARFYTSNASVKRELVQRVGGFAEAELPFLYEDLDLARRMHEHGFRLLYNPRAEAEHDHPVDLAAWRERAAAIAVAERSFVARHPDFAPYFHDRFAEAAGRAPVGRSAARLTRLLSPRVPLLGPAVWARADLFYRQQLAEPFLRAWAGPADASAAVAPGTPQGPDPALAAPGSSPGGSSTGGSPSGGSSPGGPK